jgi:hypothetical protein
LIVGKATPDVDDLLAELRRREDFQLLHVASAGHAESAVRDEAVSIAIACPDVSAGEVEGLFARGIPVLAIRDRDSAERAAWAEMGIGILRTPVLPGALGRSIDVVLGLPEMSKRKGS